MAGVLWGPPGTSGCINGYDGKTSELTAYRHPARRQHSPETPVSQTGVSGDD